MQKLINLSQILILSSFQTELEENIKIEENIG